MAQIISITSEALQATIRRLLPSQQGFGEDLQATNVVTPIIDLTPTAEGSSVPTYLQTSFGLASITDFAQHNNTGNVVTSPGFFRIFGISTIQQNGSSAESNKLTMGDGSSSKNVFFHKVEANSNAQNSVVDFDFTVFLRAGESVTATAHTEGYITGVSQQVATVDGVLVNPTGFNPQ